MRDLEAQQKRMQAHLAPLSHPLEELQAGLRRANATVKRLTPRLRQLDELVSNQKDQILAAEVADAQRNVSELRAERAEHPARTHARAASASREGGARSR
jgi:hypothetical protein